MMRMLDEARTLSESFRELLFQKSEGNRGQHEHCVKQHRFGILHLADELSIIFS